MQWIVREGLSNLLNLLIITHGGSVNKDSPCRSYFELINVLDIDIVGPSLTWR